MGCDYYQYTTLLITVEDTVHSLELEERESIYLFDLSLESFPKEEILYRSGNDIPYNLECIFKKYGPHIKLIVAQYWYMRRD